MNAQGGGTYIQIAEDALAYFRCAITELNYQFYGLSKYSKLEDVQIGQAVEHYAVGLDRLKKYTADQDPGRIIQPMGFVAVNIQVDGSENVYIMLNERDGKWQSTSLGQEYYSQAFIDLQRNSDFGEEVSLVRVPGLNLAYASTVIDEVLHLIPLQIGDEQTKDNEPRPAAEVFEELSRLIDDGEDVPR
ncbi:MAG: hypothetical protein Aureis2KO_18100 [Aureisphaera sp.]